MTHNDFTYRELFRKAYELTKRHFPFLLGVLAIDIVVGSLTSPIPLVAQLVSMALSIATIYVTLLIVSGRTPAFKDLIVPFKTYHIAWHYFLATLLMFLLVVLAAIGSLLVSSIIGLALGALVASTTGPLTISIMGLGSVPLAVPVTIGASFIVAAFIFFILVAYYGIRLGFYKYFIVDDEKVDPFESLKKSLRVTEGRFWKIFGFLILLVLLNIAGAIAFLIGLLFTLPMTFIAGTLLYRKLSGKDHGRAHDHPEHQEGQHIAAE